MQFLFLNDGFIIGRSTICVTQASTVPSSDGMEKTQYSLSILLGRFEIFIASYYPIGSKLILGA